jgi:hypothetical protein
MVKRAGRVLRPEAVTDIFSHQTRTLSFSVYGFFNLKTQPRALELQDIVVFLVKKTS